MKYPNLSYERDLWGKGYKHVCGIDEVGRGAWAGPLFAAAVIFLPEVKIKGVNDSKKLPPKKREELALAIKEKAFSWGVGKVEADFVDRFGVVKATDEAMKKSIEVLKISPGFVLVDYFKLSFFPEDRYLPIKFGDNLSLSIAAASILAKVARDELMKDFAQTYPGYGFESHVGYGTKMHQEKIRELGLSKIHRVSFIPQHLQPVVSEVAHLAPFRTTLSKIERVEP